MNVNSERDPSGFLLRRPEAAAGNDGIDLARLGMAIRRQVPLILLCAMIGAVIAIIYIASATARYSAVSTILVSAQRDDLLGEVSPVPSAARSDSMIESEVEIIKSQVLALRVVDALDLSADAGFMNPESSIIDEAKSGLRSVARGLASLVTPESSTGAAAGDVAKSPREIAATRLRDRLDVTRVGRSFVLEVSYTGPDATRTAEIVRTYGAEYQSFQVEASLTAADTAGKWLRARLSHLETMSSDAALRLREFRTESGVVPLRGELLSDQQLAEISGRLIEAQITVATAQAKLSEVRGLLADGSGSALLAAIAMLGLDDDTSGEPGLVALHRTYTDASGRYASVVARWGEAHPEAQRLGERLAATENRIRAELGHAIGALEAEARAAAEGEAGLRAALGALVNDTGAAAEQMSKLSRLEAVATTYNDLYSDFLKHFETLAQEPAYPILAVRVLSNADVPEHASSPQKSLSLAIGLALGMICGAGIGAARELRRQPLRTAGDVRQTLGLPCAGLVPLDAAGPSGSAAADDAERALLRTTDGVRQLIMQAAGLGDGQVIGIASMLPGDAVDFTQTLGDALVARGMQIAMIGAEGLRAGGRSELSGSAIRRASGAVLRGRRVEPRTRIEQSGAAETDLPAGYDVFLCALAPLSTSFEANAAAANCDATILVARWGRDTGEAVAEALDVNPAFAKRLAGVVLSGADLRVARRYLRPGSFEREAMRDA